jgi:hypothetical protein
MKQPIGAEDSRWKRLYNDRGQAEERLIQCEDYQGNLLAVLNDIPPL